MTFLSDMCNEINSLESSKKCFKCGAEKPCTDFYKHKGMADGLLGKCKKCTKADSAKHRGENLDTIREYDRKRGARQTPEYQREYRENNPDKYVATNAVNNALRSGRLKKDSCEECGAKKVHGHHDDYAKPLEVRWLCAMHHSQHHALNPRNTTEIHLP